MIYDDFDVLKYMNNEPETETVKPISAIVKQVLDNGQYLIQYNGRFYIANNILDLNIVIGNVVFVQKETTTSQYFVLGLST